MQTLDLIGIFAFAVSGALMAIGRDYDVVGIAILAVVTALGGGIIRDLVLGDTPPPLFTRWQYLVVALAAGGRCGRAGPTTASSPTAVAPQPPSSAWAHRRGARAGSSPRQAG